MSTLLSQGHTVLMIHETILVLFVYRHDVRAILIQFLVNLYREITK